MTNIQDIILHYYAESPFSQKVAWVLNYKKVDYKIVVISRVEPRPARRPLDAGYRKTPILQIGNHSYCDTKSIFLAIEKLYPQPSLYPVFTATKESSAGVARGLTNWIDSSLFLNVVSQLPVAQLDDAFLADRTAFVGRPLNREVMAAGAPFMRASLRAEFEVAVQALGDKTWVLETEAPGLVDFSFAMCTFFTLQFVGEKWVSEHLKTLFEHMQRTLGAADWERTEKLPKITEEEAIAVLKRYQETKLDADFKVHTSTLPIGLGQGVVVTPLDNGKVPAIGTLVRSTIDETVISHKDANYGTTAIVHFPVMGFIVVPKPAAK